MKIKQHEIDELHYIVTQKRFCCQGKFPRTKAALPFVVEGRKAKKCAHRQFEGEIFTNAIESDEALMPIPIRRTATNKRMNRGTTKRIAARIL